LKLDEEPPKKVDEEQDQQPPKKVDEQEEKAVVEEDQRLPKKVVKEKDQSKDEVDDVMSKMKKDPDPESYQPIRKKSGAEMQGQLLASPKLRLLT
jgi:hypothetical protein